MSWAASVRASNVRVAEGSTRQHVGSTHVPMFCECGDPECREIVMVDLDEFNTLVAQFKTLLAPGHTHTADPA